MDLKQRIIALASRDLMGRWGRIIIQDAATILGVTVEEVEEVLDEISLEGEVRFHTSNLALISRVIIFPKSPPQTTITWSLDDRAKSDYKPLTDQEIEEYMRSVYPPLVLKHSQETPPKRVEIVAGVMEHAMAWAEEYERRRPNKLIFDTVLNFIRRNYPATSMKKRREFAKTVMSHILDTRSA